MRAETKPKFDTIVTPITTWPSAPGKAELLTHRAGGGLPPPIDVKVMLCGYDARPTIVGPNERSRARAFR